VARPMRVDGADLSLVLNASSLVILLGGPAGTGKSTVGAAWCRSRPRAAMVELDAVRDCILGGRASRTPPARTFGAMAREHND
jgi:predicted kinase